VLASFSARQELRPPRRGVAATAFSTCATPYDLEENGNTSLDFRFASSVGTVMSSSVATVRLILTCVSAAVASPMSCRHRDAAHHSFPIWGGL